MFNNDVFIKEYLKIINEDDEKIKASNGFIITVERENINSEIPELEEKLADFLKNVKAENEALFKRT